MSMTMKCTVGGCDDRVRAKGLCRKHYQRMLRHGSTDDPTPAKGHPYSPENTLTVSKANPHWRGCRTCNRDKLRALRERAREVAA